MDRSEQTRDVLRGIEAGVISAERGADLLERLEAQQSEQQPEPEQQAQQQAPPTPGEQFLGELQKAQSPWTSIPVFGDEGGQR